MSAPRTRYADRTNPLVRQWRMLVLLRRAPRTLSYLASQLGCVERTVRRDLEALQAVPFPILKRPPSEFGLSPVWMIGEVPEWPRTEELPLESLRESRRGVDRVGL